MRRRPIALLLTGMLAGTLLLTPARAHFAENTRHLGSHAWREFIRERVFTRNQVMARFFTRNQSLARFPLRSEVHLHERTILVSPGESSTESGQALLDAVASVPPASFGSPWTVRVEPGSYNLGGQTLVLPSFVSLEGAGVEQTKIVCECPSDTDAVGSGAVIHIAGPGSGAVRGMFVRNEGPGDYVRGIDISGPRSTVADVELLVSGAANRASGIALFNPTTIDGTIVRLVGTAASYYGIQASGIAANLTLRDSLVSVSADNASNYGVHIEDTDADVRDTRVSVNGSNSANYGLWNSASDVVYTDVFSDVGNGFANYAFFNLDTSGRGQDDATVFDGVRAHAIGGGARYFGVYNRDAEARIIDSELVADGEESFALYNDLTAANGFERTIFVSNSILETRGGTIEEAVHNETTAGETGLTVIENSTITSSGTTISLESGFDAQVAGSRVGGGSIVGGGTVTCAGVWDETLTFFASTCPT